MTETTHRASSLGGGFDGRYDIVIAGAGFAGLALARSLAAGLGQRARIALISREALAPATRVADSRATALSATSVRMLDQLGVWALCQNEAEPVKVIDITDSGLRAGVRPFLLSYDNLVGEAEPASCILPNGCWVTLVSAPSVMAAVSIARIK